MRTPCVILFGLAIVGTLAGGWMKSGNSWASPLDIRLPDEAEFSGPVYFVAWEVARQVRQSTNAAPLFVMELLEKVTIRVAEEVSDTGLPGAMRTVVDFGVQKNNPAYPVISIEAGGQTLREVLNRIQSAAEGMRWSYDEVSNVVNLVDRRIPESQAWALNRNIPAVDLQKKDGIAALNRFARNHGVKLLVEEDLRRNSRQLGEGGLVRVSAMRNVPLRAVLNLVLSQAGPPDVALYTVKALPEGWFTDQPVTSEEALRARVLLMASDYTGYDGFAE